MAPFYLMRWKRRSLRAADRRSSVMRAPLHVQLDGCSDRSLGLDLIASFVVEHRAFSFPYVTTKSGSDQGVRTVAYYRQMARECRAVARQIQLRDAREKLLAMAREWDAHADEREASFIMARSPLPDPRLLPEPARD